MPIVNVERGDNVVITHPDLVNIYDCSIGSGSRIGPFVEIQKGSVIGRNCKISSHTFVCETAPRPLKLMLRFAKTALYSVY